MLGLGLDEIEALKRAYTQEGKCGALLMEDYGRVLDDRIREVDRRLAELKLLREDLARHRDRLMALNPPGGPGRAGGACRSLLDGWLRDGGLDPAGE